jgi:hypothetical protein
MARFNAAEAVSNVMEWDRFAEQALGDRSRSMGSSTRFT